MIQQCGDLVVRVRDTKKLHLARAGLTTLSAIVALGCATPVLAQNNNSVLLVAGPRTPESLDQEYPPTEASHEARRNIYERLLSYEMKQGENGVMVENFDKLKGALAESWETSPDKTSITFHLRKGVKSFVGDTLTADDLMWTFERGWNLKANFHWYMTQVLKIQDFKAAFQKVDDQTVKVMLPKPSPLIERIWVNNDLGIIDSVEAKKHTATDDQWASRWLASHSASYAPYQVTKYSPGQEVVYEANKNYYRGAPKITRVIFREMPTSSNRLAALQAGAVDVAEWLPARELNTLSSVPTVKVWKVYGNYVQRVEMNNSTPPFNNEKVRQALNYAVPRDEILKSVFYGTARPTKSPISEIYPAYTDKYFNYSNNLDKAKALLKEAGFEKGFKTQLGYPTGDQTEEELAIILKTAFSKIGVDVELQKLPASTLVERYSKGTMPMYFFRDMAIVPDAGYVANLWLNSASLINYSHYKNEEVDRLINDSLSSTDEPKRKAEMDRVQQLVMQQAPWIFLINPGYQLATRSNVKGYSWNTTNGNTWYDFSKN
ncbi:ABC transporter substrate-binding protein [Caballeronia sp. LZ032]|uniref:ABC transporter substrate-binding protein n=1 Tax=Caballeronia sp. LZ032 TaxID=3038565 RepID=UPI00285E62E7|nr:ABC transporter substrate-binding protein [Caballeronia sp. LZ032]MDR5880497.1 ABC transporter substrate-binding protein [Caballeronia sp. LZ032]